ncbi:MAG: arginine repressor [Bacillota bacterium]|nr:arginine repressor [Bacillota bacterium]
MKGKRQRIIKELIAEKEIETQEEITAYLRDKGINVTQATVSRDIKELGLIKVPGNNQNYKYALSTEQSPINFPQRLNRLFKDYVIGTDYSENLIIINTLPGGAPSVASGIDGSGWDEIIGTVAGDDTILVIVKPKEMVDTVLAKFQDLLE